MRLHAPTCYRYPTKQTHPRTDTRFCARARAHTQLEGRGVIGWWKALWYNNRTLIKGAGAHVLQDQRDISKVGVDWRDGGSVGAHGEEQGGLLRRTPRRAGHHWAWGLSCGQESSSRSRRNFVIGTAFLQCQFTCMAGKESRSLCANLQYEVLRGQHQVNGHPGRVINPAMQ